MVGLALCLPLLLSACALFANDMPAVPAAVRPSLPHLPANLAMPCLDPGIADDALVALVEHRQALAGCRRLHRDTVAFYRDVQRHLEDGETP